MTIHNTSKIMQRPVTDGMTHEQLKQFRETVREAQHGNCPYEIDFADAWRGRSYCVGPKTMSDYIPPKFNNEQKEVMMPDMPTTAKAEQIKKWAASIDKLEAQIEKLRDDKTLSVAERQQKIQRRLNIINDYKYSIKMAKEYLDRRARNDKELYAKFMKTK